MAGRDWSAAINAGESATFELETTLSDIRRIVETIAAMATIGGGDLLVGVRPDGRPVGAQLGQGEIERLVQRVLAHTDPRVYVDVRHVDVSGTRVLHVRVPPGDGPHLAYGRAFYRSGPATVAMTRDEYERRLLDRLRESSGFERRTEFGVTLDQVDPAQVERFLERARHRGAAVEGPWRAVLERLFLVRGNAVTVAGILLFGRFPQGALPQATVRAQAVRGVSEDAMAADGTVFEQIESVVAFVSRNLRVLPRRSGLVREEVPELPHAAVREVIANALAHREYRSTAPVQLRLDDRSLTVWNPGHFPPPITPALLREEHPSVPTNPLLARALHLAGYIEQWGTGTLRVIAAMRDNGNPEPLFEERGDGGIRVTLPLPGVVASAVPQRAATFLHDQEAGERFRTADYARSLGIAQRTALGDITKLEELGLIRREGRGKAVRWVRV